MASFDLKNATIVFHDGGSNTLTVKVMEGVISWTEKRNIIYVKDRGILDSTRLGDQEPMDVKFDLIWEFLLAVSGSGVPTPEDVLKNRGEAAGWQTTGPNCETFCIDIIITYTPICFTGHDVETFTLQYFRWEQMDCNPKEAQISVSGKCNVQFAGDTHTHTS